MTHSGRTSPSMTPDLDPIGALRSPLLTGPTHQPRRQVVSLPASAQLPPNAKVLHSAHRGLSCAIPAAANPCLGSPGKCLSPSDPVCPSVGKYTWATGNFPLVGRLMLKCTPPEHVPKDHKDW